MGAWEGNRSKVEQQKGKVHREDLYSIPFLRDSNGGSKFLCVSACARAAVYNIVQFHQDFLF